MSASVIFQLVALGDGRVLIAVNSTVTIDEKLTDLAFEVWKRLDMMAHTGERPLGADAVITVADPPGCNGCGPECRCGDDCEHAESEDDMKGKRLTPDEMPKRPFGMVESETDGSYWRKFRLPDEVENALELAEELGMRRMRRRLSSSLGNDPDKVRDDLLSLAPEQAETFRELSDWCGTGDDKKSTVDVSDAFREMERLDKLTTAVETAREHLINASALLMGARNDFTEAMTTKARVARGEEDEDGVTQEQYDLANNAQRLMEEIDQGEGES